MPTTETPQMRAAATRKANAAAKDKAATDAFGAACDALEKDPKQAEVLQVQMATCPKCQGWVFQSAYPRCQTSKDAQKEFAACLKAGLNIQTVPLAEARKVAYCKHKH